MDQLNSLYPWMAIAIPIFLAWTLPWKAVALWKAARNRQLVWFIVLFLVNTLAILEIIYIFAFSKKKTDNT
jgi:hypothetical protein